MALPEDVQWSEAHYTTKQIVEHFRLPKIFKVTRGAHETDDRDTLENLQVIRIHQVYKQRRAIATDERGRHYSIPVDYDIPFETLPVNSSRPEPQYLSEILRDNNLPKKVQFSNQMQLDAWFIDSNVKVDSNFGTLTLTKVYEESYLHTNAINDGDLDVEIILIPAFTKSHFCVAEGLRSGDDKQWAEIVERYNAIAEQKVDFGSKTGNTDISVYRPGSTEGNRQDYANIEPSQHIRVRSRKSRLYENNLNTGSEKPAMEQKKVDPKLAQRPLPPSPVKGAPTRQPIRPLSDTDDGVTLVKREPRKEIPKNDFEKKKKATKTTQKAEKNRLGPKKGSKSDKKFKSLDEVPSDLTKLSVVQVGNLLQLLDLESLVSVFEEREIDGFALKQLTVNHLTDKMGVAKVDALNLTVFVMENHKQKKKKFSFF
ncbi:uncharacterized protein [Ptychodera flava]|uniref:uncharacterized protein isoform X2 n=1 Tax=Ptychodera flava TaxID=63121 RepID=UPI00396A3F25